MQRKLLILCCVCGFALLLIHTMSIARQHKMQESFNDQMDDSINYKIPGTQMPELLLAVPQLEKKHGKIVWEKDPPVKMLTNSDIPTDANQIIMLFNPTCEHCEDQTLLFEKNIFLFKKTKIFFMASSAMMPYLEYFNNNTHVLDYPKTFTMGVDSSKFIDRIYLYQMLPQINIYDHQHKLLRIFSGDVAIDSLKQYIE